MADAIFKHPSFARRSSRVSEQSTGPGHPSPLAASFFASAATLVHASVPPEPAPALPDLAPTPGSGSLPFSHHFFDVTHVVATARTVYLRTLAIGVVGVGVIVFSMCAIYWGSIWVTPHRALPGWIVDFDGDVVGRAVTRTLGGRPGNAGTNGIVWQVVAASAFPRGVSQLEDAIAEEKTWAAVAINPGASSNLLAALSDVDSSYNSSLAMTFIGSEARSEAEYRNIILPFISSQLEKASRAFALDFARNISTSANANASALLSTAPQIITEPISYAIKNVRPFDVPVASAVTFVGLIYLLILAFFVLLVSNAARVASGLEQRLTLGSLIWVRLLTAIGAYFFVALFYALLSCAFRLPLGRRFGKAGFVIFWMLNWVGMAACGLALEAIATLLTVRFVPLFLIFWIISNMSVAGYPLEVLPRAYSFGYAYPFYNMERAVRTIVFGTKDNVGLNFGILIAWVAVSCITLPLFQWWRRRGDVAAHRRLSSSEGKA
ncbi:hypothetical protein GGX14DRAFT_181124 [Mycena pura]|uniref:DUF3533 domain-containing protein n=1 Tax=Mycena pura TaxID=153505 RepID=A0AAD6V2Y4_9AGAR|nr:hypothetical protein GGX14DRAFT_181124 [Mycena pura]